MINPFQQRPSTQGEFEPEKKPLAGDPALDELVEKAKALIAQARLYSATQVDKAKVKLRHTFVLVFLFFLALLSLAGLLIGASEYLLSGLAGGFSAATGHVWLGDLIAAIVVLGVVYGGYLLGIRQFQKSQVAKLKLKYEQSNPDNGPDAIERRTETSADRS